MLSNSGACLGRGVGRAIDLIEGVLHGKAPAELYDNTHPDPRTLICPYRGLGVFREEV
jgi:hypothetical protein